ncbi:S-layer homology domain-containing protein [Aneurinibacillus sp. REN35]|uniref:S-layer homology domain-containing protein n=1 Tax=Aneurinibacillus sp. REN35 TaxID=3237286 RepID=UPI0035279E22
MNKKKMIAGFMVVSLGCSIFGTIAPNTFSKAVVYAAAMDEVHDLRFTRLTDTAAEFQWRGTADTVRVEIKKRSNNEIIYNKEVTNRNVSVSGLKSDTEYEVYFGGESVAIFRTRGDRYNDYRYNRYYYDDYYYDDRYYYEDGYYYNGRWYYYDDRDDNYRYVRNFTIDDKDDTSVEMSWSGTSSNVYVEVKPNNSGYTKGKWANRSATFTDLSTDTQYSVYIDGRYMTAFRTETTSKASDVSINKNTANRSVEVTWKGTSGSVKAVIKRGDSQVEEKWTSEKRVSFYNLDYNRTYSLYIDNKYIQTFSLTHSDTPSSVWLPTVYPPAPSYNPSIAASFSDVQGHWAQSAIERLASYGVVQGFSDGTFLPRKQVSREEFTVMLVSALKIPVDTGTTGFRDIAATHWSAPYIAAAVQNRIVYPNEYYGQRFIGQQAITREDAAIMVARALKLTPDKEGLFFSDTDSIKNPGLVGAVVKEGIMSGLPNGRFDPKGSLTRAAAAVMLNEFYHPY